MLIFFWFQPTSTPEPETPSIVRQFAYGQGVTMKHIVHPYHVFTTRY